MSKHSPGPWADGADGRVADAQGFMVAQTYGRDHLANARLIAAAPELLAALKEAYVALECAVDCGDWAALIARIEGETP